jgi:hypothetical protein
VSGETVVELDARVLYSHTETHAEQDAGLEIPNDDKVKPPMVGTVHDEMDSNIAQKEQASYMDEADTTLESSATVNLPPPVFIRPGPSIDNDEDVVDYSVSDFSPEISRVVNSDLEFPAVITEATETLNLDVKKQSLGLGISDLDQDFKSVEVEDFEDDLEGDLTLLSQGELEQIAASIKDDDFGNPDYKHEARNDPQNDSPSSPSGQIVATVLPLSDDGNNTSVQKSETDETSNKEGSETDEDSEQHESDVDHGSDDKDGSETDEDPDNHGPGVSQSSEMPEPEAKEYTKDDSLDDSKKFADHQSHSSDENDLRKASSAPFSSYSSSLSSSSEDGSVQRDANGTHADMPFGTPGRRSSLTSDSVIGTPVNTSTSSGPVPVTPQFSFKHASARNSIINSPALPSSRTSSQVGSPPKSPFSKPSTPIKVFSPATGVTPRSVKASPTKSSVIDDAELFVELSPSTSQMISGDAKSPEKPFPSNPLKRPFHQFSREGSGETSELERFSPIKSTDQLSCNGLLSQINRQSSLSPRKSKDSPGYDSLFGDTFSLTPIQISASEQPLILPQSRRLPSAVETTGLPGRATDDEQESGILSEDNYTFSPKKITPGRQIVHNFGESSQSSLNGTGVKPAPTLTHANKDRLSKTAPRLTLSQQSSELFAEDGSPKIYIKAQSTPTQILELSRIEDEDSRKVGQSSPVKHSPSAPLHKIPDESFELGTGLPLSPPTTSLGVEQMHPHEVHNCEYSHLSTFNITI